MKKVKQYYYLIQEPIFNDESQWIGDRVMKVISIDSMRRQPWKDPLAKSILEAKIKQVFEECTSNKFIKVDFDPLYLNENTNCSIEIHYEDEDGKNSIDWELEKVDIL